MARLAAGCLLLLLSCRVGSTISRFFAATSCLDGLVIPPDCFLRVSFGDESCDRLFSSRDEPIDAFYHHMRSVMRQGGSGAAVPAWQPSLPDSHSCGTQRLCPGWVAGQQPLCTLFWCRDCCVHRCDGERAPLCIPGLLIQPAQGVHRTACGAEMLHEQ